MKKILYLFVIAVLLAACTSKNEVRTYKNGKLYVLQSYKDNGKMLFDTISIKDVVYELNVLIDKDTIWLNSGAFSKDKEHIFKNSIYIYMTGKEDIELPVVATSTNDYYAVMNYGKFYNYNEILAIYYWRMTAKNISTNPFEEVIYAEDIQYKLDKEQFKQLKK